MKTTSYPYGICFSLFLLLCFTSIFAQNYVGIGTYSPDSSAALHIEATDQGLLIPLMNSETRTAISDPAEGLMVYDSTFKAFYFYTGVTWQEISERFYAQISDADLDTRIEVEESDDEDYIRFYTSGNEILTVDPSGGVGLGKIDFVEDTVILESWDDLSYNYVNEGGFGGGSEQYQSFTLEKGYTVHFIDVYLHSLYVQTDQTTLDVNLYEGEGTAGNLVYQATGVSFSGFNNGAWIRIDVSDFTTVEDTIYSLELSDYEFWSYSTGNGYTDGKSSSGNLVDFYFRVYGIDNNSHPVAVDSNGFRIGAYTLPYTAGNSGEVLVTDGVGNLSWQYLNYEVITDADEDTQVWVEENADEDHIRLYAGGKEVLIVDSIGGVQLGYDENTDSSYVQIDSTGLHIGTYTLPYTDGNNGEYLVTDGAGSLTWQSVASTDDQNLSLSSDNLLSITNANSVDLSFLNTLQDADGDTKIEVEAVSGANQLQFTTNDTARMLLTSSANVGIGTDAPEQLLHLALDNTDSLNIPLLLTNTDFSNAGGNAIGIGFVNATFNNPKGAIVHERSASNGRGNLHILLDNAIDKDSVDLDDAVATFTRDGKVGIATTAPDTTFHLVGGFKYDNGNQSDRYVLTSDANGNASWQSAIETNTFSDTDGDTKIQLEESADEDVIRFDIAGTEAMQINTSGNVGFSDSIGIGINLPTKPLHIQLDNEDFNLPLFLHNTDGSVNGTNGVGMGFLSATHSNPKAALFFERTDNWGLGSFHVLLNNESSNNNPADMDDAVATFTKDGYVGIGTTDPTNGKLEVVGSATSAVTLSNYGYYRDNNFGALLGGPLNRFFSIYADGNIGANEFYAHSDERIKAILGKSDAAADLDVLKQIKVTDYQYKDKVAMGNGVQKKVIAQELKAIYPQAVDTTTIKVVPDIYQMASIQNGWVALATDLKVGEQVQLLLEDSKALYEVEEVNAQSFKVASTDSGAVFVYGRQVSNFHTVDYQAISMLNVSATQALIKQLKTLETDNQTKQSQINSWRTDLEVMQERLAKIERMLTKPLESAQNPLTVKK